MRHPDVGQVAAPRREPLAFQEWQRPVLDEASCTRTRHRLSTCRRCAEACPVGAIDSGEAVVMDPDRCLACARCVAACPTGALVASPSAVATVAKAVGRIIDGVVSLACARVEDPTTDPDLRVPCLGAIGEEIMLGIIARGAGRLRLVSGDCENCPSRTDMPVRSTADVCNALLVALGRSETIEFVQEQRSVRSSQPLVRTTRRGFLEVLTRRSASTAISAIVPSFPAFLLEAEPDERGPGKDFPEKRLLLTHALHALSRTDVMEVPKEAAGLFRAARVASECTGCGMCACFCPTEALILDKNTNQHTLSFSWEGCTGCHLCGDLCYRRAIRIDSVERVDLTDRRPLVAWSAPAVSPGDLVREWAAETLS